MTVHPHLEDLISRERQREMMARADRQRLLRGLARQARRTGGTGPRPRRAWRAALRLSRLRPQHRTAR
jgi:hypothetical protein